MAITADRFGEFEWEGIQSSLKLTRLNHGGKLLTGSATASIARSESYRLRCEVQGFSDHPFKAPLEVQKLASSDFTFSGNGGTGVTTLSGCFIRGMHNTVDCDSGTYRNNTFTLNIHTDIVEQRAHGNWTEITHSDWFLNGPGGLVFTKTSARDQSHKYSRKIDHLAGYHIQATRDSGGGSVDSIVVSLPDFSFVVREVPDDFEPSWSRKVCIDYSKKISPIPSEETREAIAEFVGFVFGRRLIAIGDTSFGEDDIPFLQRSWNPQGINIQNLCSIMDFPPCPIDRKQSRSVLDIELLLKTLTPRYIRLRRILNLDHALWRYWTFQEMPLGVNLPIIVNGLEILASAWYSSDFSNSKGRFVSGKIFHELLEQDFQSIRSKLTEAAISQSTATGLTDLKSVEALMGRIRDSFLMGWSARMNQFFVELGIDLNSAEKLALKARNEQTHAFADPSQAPELWKNGELLHTLFHKVLLRILNYSGEFLDYSEQYPATRKLICIREHNQAYCNMLT